MTDSRRIAGSRTEWFLGYAVVLFVLSGVALFSGAYVFAGVTFAIGASGVFGGWRAWKRR